MGLRGLRKRKCAEIQATRLQPFRAVGGSSPDLPSPAEWILGAPDVLTSSAEPAESELQERVLRHSWSRHPPLPIPVDRERKGLESGGICRQPGAPLLSQASPTCPPGSGPSATPLPCISLAQACWVFCWLTLSQGKNEFDPGGNWTQKLHSF